MLDRSAGHSTRRVHYHVRRSLNWLKAKSLLLTYAAPLGLYVMPTMLGIAANHSPRVCLEGNTEAVFPLLDFLRLPPHCCVMLGWYLPVLHKHWILGLQAGDQAWT